MNNNFSSDAEEFAKTQGIKSWDWWKTEEFKIGQTIKFEWSGMVLEGEITYVYPEVLAVRLTKPAYRGLIMKVLKEEVIRDSDP